MNRTIFGHSLDRWLSSTPVVACLAILFPVLHPEARAAEGVRTLPDSAEALGMAGGRLANLSDASVTRSNPANLSTLDRPQVMITSQPWYGETDFTGVNGREDSMILPWKPLGSLYAAVPLSDGVTAGLGIAAPFGVSISWPRDGAFRYVAPFDAVLQTAALNPAIGFDLGENLSVGLGLDIFYSRLKLDQYFPWGLLTGRPGTPDGIMEFEADGWGLGAYFGTTLRISDHQRLALTGRLPVTVSYSGDFHIDTVPGAFGAAFANDSRFETEIEHPGSVGVGYGIDLTERLMFGIDFEWIQNSAHDDLPLDIGRNQALLPADRLVLDWEDSWSIGAGLAYDLDDRWTVRTGYLFSKSPIPDHTFNPAIPTNDRHLFSVGIGYALPKGSIDLAYSFVPMRDRTIRGNQQPAFDGDYDITWSVFTLSLTRYF